MPNSEKVSGIRAATGMLRPKIVSGAEEGVDPRKAAAKHAQRHADRRRQAKAQRDAAADWRVDCASTRLVEPEAGESWRMSRRTGQRRADDRRTAFDRQLRHGHHSPRQTTTHKTPDHCLPAGTSARSRLKRRLHGPEPPDRAFGSRSGRRRFGSLGAGWVMELVSPARTGSR